MTLDNIVVSSSITFDNKGGYKILPSNKAVKLTDNQCCLWQNLDYRDPETYKLLSEDYGIDATIVEALCDDETRPRSFMHDDALILILRAVNFNKGSEPDDMISLRIWIDSQKIITLSHRPTQAIKNVMDSLEKGVGPKNPTACLIRIAHNLANEISEVVNDINDRTTDLEEEVIDMDNLSDFELRGKLSNLRREIITLRRYIAPQKEIFQTLHNEKSALLNPKSKAEIREIYNDITKSIEDLDYTRDHLAVSHEELQSKMSISMNKIIYMISIVTVIFMPLGLLTSLLGINVEGIPYATKPYAFGVVCLILLTISGFLITLLKKIRWL